LGVSIPGQERVLPPYRTESVFTMLDTRRAHCRVPRGRVSGFHLRKKGIWDKEGGEDEKEKDAKRVLQHDHAGSRHARVEMGDHK